MAQLKRSLGLASLTFYGVGLILGAGIYSIIGAAAGAAGDALWVSFVLAAAVALLTSLAYAELATMYPEAGAEYVYVAKAFPKPAWPRRMLGAMLIAAGVATAATVATAFAGYFLAFVDLPPLLVSAGLLVLMAGMNIIGIRESSWANIAMTTIEAAGLVLVIVAGMRDPAFGKALTSQLNVGVLSGAGLVFFSFLGFEEIANLAEESKEPGRNLPRAILLCLGISTLLYILVALACVALLPAESLAESKRPLAEAVSKQWPQMSGVLGGIAIFATANTALIAMIAASRMAFSMARSNDLPKALSKVLPKRNSPWVAAIAILALAIALLPLRDAAVLGGMASFAALLAFASVHLSLIVLRRRDPKEDRPFRMPLNVFGWPVLAIVGLLGALGLALTLPRIAFLGGLAFLGILGLIELARWIISKS